jgi:formylglycine-generating enzyme required for sulfatase activity
MVFVSVPPAKVWFCIWETRVQDFEAFVNATGHDAGANSFDRQLNWQNPGFEQGSTHCAVNVSWKSATAFCRWLTTREQTDGALAPGAQYRLPTDCEWSAAAGLEAETGDEPAQRNGRIHDAFPWGNQWPPPANAGNYRDVAFSRATSKGGAFENYDDTWANSAPVGSFMPNPFGLYDLGGNDWEWCADYFDSSSGNKVIRGASFLDSGRRALLASNRMGYGADYRHCNVGFRCVLAEKDGGPPVLNFPPTRR